MKKELEQKLFEMLRYDEQVSISNYKEYKKQLYSKTILSHILVSLSEIELKAFIYDLEQLHLEGKIT